MSMRPPRPAASPSNDSKAADRLYSVPPMESPARGKIPYLKALAAVAALFVLYVLLGFFAAPPLVRHMVAGFVEETLQRKATFGDVRVNPLVLSLEMKDVALTEKNGAPIAGFQRLFGNFQASSLLRLAW